MSWVQEEWKDGLNQKVLIKINNLENQNEKLKKEAKQKQFQLESMEAAFSKQKKRAEDEKSEITLLKRECQSLTEVCSKLECKVEKISQELRSKESYCVNIEGQLQRCRTQLDQYTSRTPKHHRKEAGQSDELKSRVEEVEILLQQEKLKNKTLEKEIADLNILKKPPPSASKYNPTLPWATDDYTSPVKHTKPSVVDLLTGSPLAGGGDALVSLQSAAFLPIESKQNKELKKQLNASSQCYEELAVKVKDLESKLREAEKLAGRRLDEVSKQQALLEDANLKVCDCERKLNCVTDELNCERHNAELTRSNLQRKAKEQEKVQREEVSRAEDALRKLEEQLLNVKQEMNKELGDSRSELQHVRAELDKASSNRNKLDDELKKSKQQVFQLEQLKLINAKKISEFESTLKTITKERDSLLQRLDTCDNKRTDLQTRNELLSKDMKASQCQLNSAQQNRERLEIELKDCKEKARLSAKNNEVYIDNLKSTLSDCERKKQAAEESIKCKDREVAELSTKLVESEKKASDLSKQLRRAEENNQVTSQEKAIALNKLETSAIEAEKLDAELTRIKKVHGVEMQEVLGRLEEEKQSLKQKLESNFVTSQEEVASMLKKQRAEMDTLKVKANDQEILLSKLSQEANEKDGRLKCVDAEMENMRLNAKKLQGANDDLCVETKCLICQLDELSKTRGNLQKKLDVALEDLSTLQTRHRGILEESQVNEIERQCLEGRVRDLEEQVEKLKMLEVEKREEFVQSMEEASAEMSRELIAIKAQNAELEETIEKLSKEKETFEDEMKELAEIASLYETAQLTLTRVDDEMKAHGQRMEDANAENQRLLTENQALNEKLKASSTQADELSRMKDENSRINDELQTHLTLLQKQVEEADRRSTLLEDSATNFESIASSLSEKLERESLEHEGALRSVQSALAQAQADRDDLSAETRSLKVSLVEVTSEKSSSDDLADTRLSLIHDYKEQVEQLINELSETGEACKLIQLTLNNSNKMREDLEERISILEQELEAKEDKICEVNAECDRRTDNAKAMEEKLAGARTMLETKEELLVEVEGELEMLQQNINRKTSEITRLSRDNEKAESLLNAKLAEVGDEVSLLQDKLLAAQNELAAANQVNSQLKVRNEDSSKQVEDLEIKSQQLLGNVELLQMDVEDKDEIINELRLMTVPDLETAMSLRCEEICELSNQVGKITTDRDERLKENASLLEELSSVSLELAKQKSAFETLQIEVETLQGSNASLDERVQALDESLSLKAKSNRDLQVSSAANVSQQAQRISELKSSFKGAREESKKLRKEISELTNEKKKVDDDLKSTSAALEENLTVVQTQKDKIEKLEKMIETKEKELKAMEEECEELHSSSKEVRKTAREARVKVENLEALYNRISIDNTNLREENRNLISEITTASRTLMELEDQLDAAESKLIEVSNHEEVVPKLQQELEIRTKENKNLRQDLESISDQLDAKVKDYENLATDCKDVSIQSVNQNQTISKYKVEVDKLNAEKTILSEESLELQIQIDSLLSKLSDQQIELDGRKVATLGLVTSHVLGNRNLDRKDAELKWEDHGVFAEQDSTDLKSAPLVLEEGDVSKQNVDAESVRAQASFDVEVQAVNDRTDDLAQKLREVNKDKARLEGFLNKKQMEAGKLDEEIVKLRTDLNESAQIISEMEHDRFVLEENVGRLTKEEMDLRRIAEDLGLELSSLRVDYNLKVETFAEEMEKMKKRLESQHELKRECVDLEAHLLEKEDACSRLRQGLIKVESELEDVQESLHGILAERDALVQGAMKKSEEMEEMRRDMRRVEASKMELAGKMEENTQDHIKAVQLMRDEIEGLKMELGESLDGNREMEEMMRAKEEEVRGMEEQLGTLQSKYLQLTSTHDSSESQREALAEEVEQVGRLLSVVRDEADQAKVEIAGLVVDNIALKASSDCTSTRLNLELRDATAKLEEISTQLDISEQSLQRKSDAFIEAEHARCESAAALEAAELVISKFRAEVEQLSFSEANIKTELKELRMENDELSGGNLALTKQLDCNVHDIARLHHEVNGLTDYLRESKVEKERYQLLSDQHEKNFNSFVEEMKQQNTELELQAKEDARKLQVSEKQCHVFESSTRKMEKFIAELEDKLNLTTLKSASEVSVLESKLRCTSDDASLDRSRHEETVAAINAEIEEMKSHQKNIKRELKDAKRQNKVKNKSIIELEDKLSASEQARTEAAIKHDLLTTTTQQLQNQLNFNETQLRDKDMEVEKIRSELCENDAELEQIRSKLCEKDAELEQIRSNVCEKDAEMEQICTKICEKDVELEQIRSELCRKDAELEQIRSKLREKDAELEQIHSKVCEKDAELEQIHSKVCEKDAELEQIHSKVCEKGAELEQIHSKVCEKDAELEQIHSKISEKDAELEHMHSKVCDKDAELEQIHSRLSEKDAELEQIHSRLSEKDVELEQLHSKVCEKDIELEQMRSGVCVKDAELEQIHSKVFEKDAELKHIHSQVCEKDAELEQIHSKVCEKDAELEQIHSKVSEKDAELEHMHSKVCEKDAELEQIHSRVSEKDMELEQLHSKVCEKDTELGQIRSEVCVKDAELEQILSDFSKKEAEMERSCIKLREENAELDQVCAKLCKRDAELEEMKTANGNLNEEITRIGLELKEKVQSLLHAEESIADLREKIEDDKERIRRLEEDLLIERDEVLKMEKETGSLVEEKAMLVSKLDEAGALVEEHGERISCHRLELDTWNKEKQSLMGKISSFVEVIDELKLKIDEDAANIASSSSLIRELQEEKSKNIASTEMEMERLRHDHNLATREIDRLQTSSSSLNEDLSHLEEKVSALNLETAQLKKELSESKQARSSLVDDISQWKDKCRDTESKLEARDCHINKVEVDLLDMKHAHSLLLAEKEALRFEVDRMLEILRNYEAKVEALTQTMQVDEQSHEEERRRLEESVAAFSQQIQQLQIDLDSKQDELLAKDAELEQIHSKIFEKDAELEKIHSKVFEKDAELEQIHSKVCEKDAELEQIHSKIFEKDAELENIHSKVFEKDTELEQIHSKVCEKDAELEQMHSKVCEKDAELEQIHSKVCEKDAELEQTHSKVCEKDAELEQIHSKVCEKDAELEQIHSKVCEKDAELEQMRSKVCEKDMELEQLCANEDKLRHEHDLVVREKQQEIERLQTTSSSLNDEVSRLNDEVSASNEEGSRLIDEVTCLKQECSSMASRLEERMREDASVWEAERKELSSFLDAKNDAINDYEDRISLMTSTNLEQFESLEEEWRKGEDVNKALADENRLLTEQMKVKECQIEETREKLSMLESILAETSLTNSHMAEELKNLNEAIRADAARYKKRTKQLCDENETVLESFATLKRAAKALQGERDALEVERSEGCERMRRMEEQEERLEHEKLILERKLGRLEDDVCALRVELGAMGDMEGAVEQMSIQNGDLEDRLKEVEGLLDETSLAMEDLRLKLHEEREKVAEQQQTIALNEAQSRDEIASLLCDVTRLRDNLAVLETDRGTELKRLTESYGARELELKEHLDIVLRDFDVLKIEVEGMEERNSALDMEVIRLRSAVRDMDANRKQAISKVEEVMQDMERIQCDADSSEAERNRLQHQVRILEEDLEKFNEQGQRLSELKSEKLKLKKEMETLRGKLTLMTSTARRKEKELHRALKMLSERKEGSNHSSVQSDHPHPTVPPPSSTQSITVKRSRPRRSSRKSIKLEKVVLDRVDDVTATRKSPKKLRPSDGSSTPSSPGCQVEGLPHLVNKDVKEDRRPNAPLGEDLPSKLAPPQESSSEPLQTVTNSPKHATLSPPGTRDHQLRLGVSKSPSKKSGPDEEVECKVQ